MTKATSDKMNNVKIALNICTYKREQILRKNLQILKDSEFFNSGNSHYFDKLHIFVVDNSSEMELDNDRNIHMFHNPNTGGSGGFQRGIEEIRKFNIFTHVIFMDDDVSFEMNSFYILYDFLETVNKENADRPIAGRMLDKDNPNIQWTAAEKWNSGDIKHVEFLRDITDSTYPYIPGRAVYDADADYGGFWFCCYPYSFVKDNDIMPFFLHCDDVEYGLRCGKRPIIIEGVHVWHETWDKKITPVLAYYDTRNPLFVNEKYNLLPGKDELITHWKNCVDFYCKNKEYISALAVIRGIEDYLKGYIWLQNNDLEKSHIELEKYLGKNKVKYLCLKYALLKIKKMIKSHDFSSLK